MNSKALTVSVLVSAFAFSAMNNSVNSAVKHHAEQSSTHVVVEEFATDLDNPWGLVFLPNGELLVTQRSGDLLKLSANGDVIGPVSGLPKAVVKGQGGMLGITIHPDFASNQMVYVCLNVAGEGGAGSEVHAGKLVGNTLQNVKPVFVAQPKADTGYHFGCRVTFDNQQHLFISLGDRGIGKDLAQDINLHYGKVIRVNADGSVPSDNPFVGKDGADDVFSYGHRNVQGMTRHPETGDIWTHEHGPKGGDEINILAAGNNYGWPKITYGVNYNGSIITDKTAMEGMQQPLTYWDPSIAPSGMTFYTGDMFKEWKGHVLIGSLKFRHLRRVELDSNNKVVAQHEMLADRNERIRDVVQAPDDSIFVVVDGVDGKILRLSTQ
ncbi:MAG: PQQ-dependent sugar dehydrogenase [Glaciecola sp.]